MKFQLVLFVLIVSSAFIVEAHDGVRFIPRTKEKDPWLIPKEGVLVTDHTPIYLATIEENAIFPEVEYSEVSSMMREVTLKLLNDQKYRKASVGDIRNPHDYSNLKSMTPSSEPSQWPYILYPKLLIVVNYGLYEKLGNDLMKAIPYLLAFWNGVDMMFRPFENPKIRLNIAGIIFETKSGVFDYLTPDTNGTGEINHRAVHTAKKFWKTQRDHIPLKNYDQVVTMTNSLICLNPGEECSASALGQSWTSSMCSNDSRYETRKVIIFEDDGKFSGIPVVAHELGHSLGMNHDENGQFISEEELKDLPSCINVSHDHIMSAFPSYEVYHREWSQCSLEQLEKFIKTKNPTCLYNPPAVGGISIPRLLPGKLAAMDLFGSCKESDSSSICHDPSAWSCKKIRCHPFDIVGTPCESSKPNAFCMFAKCVSESEFT